MSADGTQMSEVGATNVAAAEASASKARLRLWLRMLKATRSMEAEIRESLRRDHDTTLPRFDVMAALYRTADGLRMTDLSGQLRVSNGNVTGIVERLVQDGLVARQPVQGDRRAMQVRLTAEGHTAFEALAARHEAWIDDMLGGITPEAANDMAVQLRTITRHFDERERR